MATDKNKDYDTSSAKLTSADLQAILEVNKKAIEIHLEVEKQYEEILEHLVHCKTKIDEIDRYLFKLVIALSSIGISAIVGIIQLFLSHK
jgi:hypothetical protein